MRSTVAALTVWITLAAVPGQATVVRIASKSFTESVILGEISAQLIRAAGNEAQHSAGLGGSRIVFAALEGGEIDIYPEYTGTIEREILAEEIAAGANLQGDDNLRAALARRGIRMSERLGFNNTYAIGMKEEEAQRLNLRTISDLVDHPDLVFGLTNEFMDRSDGWPALRTRYGLPQQNVRGLDHDLAYRGIRAGTISVTDLYSTDADIQAYGLRVLQDDRQHFPEYGAVLLYRDDLVKRAPTAVAALATLAGRISEKDMIAMNTRAKIEHIPEAMVAAEFVGQSFGLRSDVSQDTLMQRLWMRTIEHLWLVAVSLSGAIVTAIPLGIFAAKRRRAGQAVLALVGIVQTIPSLALLVFMIPLLGIGGPPAIVALFLYSLLPIVRNTYSGLHEIASPLRESAAALGLSAFATLWRIELPLASRSIVAGVKTSAVINIGTATLGALIGAGGYGQPILTGIRLDNVGLILEGAVPAAMLALLAQGLFELAERAAVPKGLRLQQSTR